MYFFFSYWLKQGAAEEFQFPPFSQMVGQARVDFYLRSSRWEKKQNIEGGIEVQASLSLIVSGQLNNESMSYHIPRQTSAGKPILCCLLK